MLIRLQSGLEAAVSDEYTSSHWIATFMWEALGLHVTSDSVSST